MNSLKAWIERRPVRAVVVAAIIAAVIASQLGLAVGYKIEHDRTAADVRRLKKGGSTTATTKVGAARVGGKATTVGAIGDTRRDIRHPTEQNET